MKRGLKIVMVVLGVGLLYYAGDRVNYWYRRRWHFAPGMQDLPPLDRSGWPKPPAAWTSETRAVEVATPAGLKKITITYHVNSLGLQFVRIEPGTFIMGLTDELAKAVGPGAPVGGPMYTQHEVRLAKPYFIAAYETTNKEYEQFDPAHKTSRPKYQRGADGDNQPVQPIAWHKAQEYCRWLSQKEGRLYRLPTEAEWEYACRAGTTSRMYWGEDFHDRTKANLGGYTKKTHEHYADDGFEFTAPVGSFPPNPWGLYDMIGNAWEHVQDWYAPFTAAPAVDPQGPPLGAGGPCRGGSLGCRVHKGGSWRGTLPYCCSAERDGDDPGDLKDLCGFRIACEIE